MSIKIYLLIVTILLLNGFSAQAKEILQLFPEFEPTACKKVGSEDYSIGDCDVALQKIQKRQGEEQLPDEQRYKHQRIGGSILIEKKIGYRAGLYKIQVEGESTSSSGFIIGSAKSALMFELGDYKGCDGGNAIEIIKNTSEFTLFYWVCGHKSHRQVFSDYYYLNFDKRYQRLDEVFHAAGYMNSVIVNEPKLSVSKGQYQFRWPDFQYPDGDKANIYYDFKFTGSRPEDLTCLRSWNDDCSVSPQDPPIPVGKYKILEEDSLKD